MPANPKHLSSPGQRALKITAGVLGGLILTILTHNALGVLLKEKGWLVITSAYSSFLLWVTLLIIAFLSKNGWKTWAIYLVFICFFGIIIYLNK